MPAVYFYARSTHFDPDTFFTEPAINWGNPTEEADVLGIKGGRSVMLAALRLIHYLGFRVVFLFDADFKMGTDAERNYTFEQGRTKQAVQHNHRLYHALDRRFAELRKRFREFWVFNCTPDSGLNPLPHGDFSGGGAMAIRCSGARLRHLRFGMGEKHVHPVCIGRMKGADHRGGHPAGSEVTLPGAWDFV